MYSIVLINSLKLVLMFIVLAIIIYFWFFRIRRLVNAYLEALCELIDAVPQKNKWIPIYSKSEAIGMYQGRQVVGGIRYLGKGLEWMPLPYIRIKLKDVIRYNYHRVPNFAYIERGWLVFKITEHLSWGILDKEYKRFFSKDYISIALSRLLAVVEDVERGKTLEEIFK